MFSRLGISDSKRVLQARYVCSDGIGRLHVHDVIADEAMMMLRFTDGDR